MKHLIWILFFCSVAYGASIIQGDTWRSADLSKTFTPPATSQTLQGTSLDNTQIWVGNASNVSVARTMSGDASISNTGVLTIANEAVTSAKIFRNTITYNKLAATSSGRILVGSSSGDFTAVDMSGDASIASTGTLTLVTTGVTANTYRGGVTVDTKGRVTSGISSFDLSQVQAGTTLAVANGGTGRSSSTFFGYGQITGGNIKLGTTSTGGFVGMESSDLTLTPATNSSAIGICCSSTNACTSPSTSATTCAAGSESVSVSFTPPRAGYYEICFQTVWYRDSASGGSLDLSMAVKIAETGTATQTISADNGGVSWGDKRGLIAATTYLLSTNDMICRDFYLGTVATKAFRLMYNMTAAGTAASNLILADNSNQRSVYVRVKEIQQ